MTAALPETGDRSLRKTQSTNSEIPSRTEAVAPKSFWFIPLEKALAAELVVENHSDRSYCAKATVVEWSADNKIVCRLSFEFPVQDHKKKQLALAIEEFRGKKFKVWQRELDVEMKKCFAQITNRRSAK